MTTITSIKNPLIKQIAAYQAKSKERRADKVVLIEGKKETELAVSSNVKFLKILFCPEIISEKDARNLVGKQFDTAEIYGLGTGETNLGKAMKELGITRKKVVISTKIFKIGNDPNDCFLSRKHVVEGLKNSLQ